MKKLLVTLSLTWCLQALGADPAKLPLGTLKFDLDNKEVYFPKAYMSFSRYQKNQYRLTISAIDRGQNILELKFNIGAKKPKKERLIELNHQGMMVVFRSRHHENFALMPLYKKVKPGNTRYHDRENRRPEWADKTLQERLKSGLGVNRNHTMAGSNFTLRIIPVYKNGKFKELRGVFSGIVGQKLRRKSGKAALIANGEFRVDANLIGVDK